MKKTPLHDQSFKASNSKGKNWENRCGNTEGRREITILPEVTRKALIKIFAIIYIYIYMQIICICHRTWQIYFWNGGTRCYNLTESTEPSNAWRMVDHFPQILRNVLFESHKILNLLEKKSHEGYMYMMGVKLFPQNMLWEKNRCVPPGSITLFWKSSWFMLGYDEMD